MASRRRRPRLSEADLELWSRVTRDTRRLSPDDAPKASAPDPAQVPHAPPSDPSRAPATPLPDPRNDPENAPSAPRPAPEKTPSRTLRPTGRTAPATAYRPAPPLLDALDPATGLDANTARRLKRGRLAPEARLDLHGMTADRAHAALNRFIADSRRAGLRRVLVITGKGGRRPPEDAPYMPERTGVLRHAVPQWLRTPPLAGQITGVFAAHRTQGGEGALYVYLRKPL